MMKAKSFALRLSLVIALALAVACTGWVAIASADETTTVAPIVDECGQVGGDGAVTSDIYKMAIQECTEAGGRNDIGFGVDSRYFSTYDAPAAPTAVTMWENYAYAQYAVNGHNLITVTVDVAPEGISFSPVMVYAHNGGDVLEVNNTVKTTSTNWTRFAYTYIIGDGADWVRVLPTAYVEGDALAMWMQQITKVEITHVETLPDKDPEEQPATVYTDICDGKTGESHAASDPLINVSVVLGDTNKIGDPERFVYGTHPVHQESYIQYSMGARDTIMVTVYEEILEGNVRPEKTTQVVFGIVGTAVWPNENTKTEDQATVTVELGDYATGRWTKLTIVYTNAALKGAEQARVWVSMAKPTEDQSQLQIGTVDLFDSAVTDVNKLKAQHDLDRYSYLKDPSNYSDTGWDAVRAVVTDALTAIDEAESDAVEGIVTKAKADIDAVKTVAQEFEESKPAKKQEIADYAAAKGETNYTAENWQKIQAAVTEAQTAIDSATSQSQIDNAILDAKEKIDDVPTGGDDKPNTGDKPGTGDEPSGENGGKKKKCGGSAAATAASAGAVLLFGAALLVTVRAKKAA